MASAINDEMKMAAAQALAKLAKEDVPDSVIKAYGGEKFKFGRNYIIPKPLDPRVLLWEAPAVAKAAMETGVARQPIADLDAYRDALESRFGRSKRSCGCSFTKRSSLPKRIVFPEGTEDKILRASQIVLDEEIATPILLGNEQVIREKIKMLDLDLTGRGDRRIRPPRPSWTSTPRSSTICASGRVSAGPMRAASCSAGRSTSA